MLLLVASLLVGSGVRLYRSKRSCIAEIPTPLSHPATDTSNDSSRVPTLDSLIEHVERALADTLLLEAKPALVNVNTASVAELCLLPGIGPKLAARIVTYREKHGRFERMEDLVRVSGIGEKKLAAIAAMITLGN